MKAEKFSISFPAEFSDEVREAAHNSGQSLSIWLADAATAKLRSEALSEPSTIGNGNTAPLLPRNSVVPKLNSVFGLTSSPVERSRPRRRSVRRR
jgi:hypothetical protein